MQAFTESNGDIEKAERQIITNKLNSKHNNHNNLARDEHFKVDDGGIEVHKYEEKQLIEDGKVLQALVGCTLYTAKEALKNLGDVRTAENFLKKAIDFCRGDEEQAIRLISINILELGAINDLTKCQRGALDYIA